MSDHAEPPSTPSHDVDRIASLGTYFVENRGRFTPDALRRAAAAAGYTAEEIEAAWPRSGWEVSEGPKATPADVGVSIAIAVVYAAGIWFGGLGLASNPTTDEWAGPAFLAALVGGALVWFALRRTAPAVSRGVGWGVVVAVVLPVIVFLAIVGICLAMGYQV
jgi:hypothetical protein